MTLSNLQEAIRILRKYKPDDSHIILRAATIWLGSTAPGDMSDDDRHTLELLHWRWDGESWRHFV